MAPMEREAEVEFTITEREPADDSAGMDDMRTDLLGDEEEGVGGGAGGGTAAAVADPAVAAAGRVWGEGWG